MCDRVGSVSHKWIPNTPQAQHPLAPVPLVGRGLLFEVLAPELLVAEVMQLVLAEACLAVATGHSLLPIDLCCEEQCTFTPPFL